jgi:hypothetical protein
MERLPGPICTVKMGSDCDEGTLVRSRNNSPGPSGLPDLTKEERELVLDISQIILDLAGVIDPTPASDGTNLVISVARGDWFGAGISGLSLIPYVGDLAKAGKLGRWMQTIEKVLRQARKNVRFAERVRPLLQKLRNILDQVPTSVLPDSAKDKMTIIKKQVNSALGKAPKVRRSLLIDRYLKKWERYIDKELQLKPPARDRGALWSKLGGGEFAEKFAALRGKQTLESVLENTKFQEKYNLAVAQLKERLGSNITDAEVWNEFGFFVWLEVSQKYVALLKGRVTVYVDSPALKDALKTYLNRDIKDVKNFTDIPIVHLELRQLVERMRKNPEITEIILEDVMDSAKIIDH